MLDIIGGADLMSFVQFEAVARFKSRFLEGADGTGVMGGVGKL
jgi:hypothetical protein